MHGTAAIVTTTASEETQQIHDRMPVILEKPDFVRWLASEPLATQEAHGCPHVHESVPFLMDGSGKAALDVKR